MTEAAESAVGITPDVGYRARYPWHADMWARLTHDLSALPHALLLHGSTGLGKRAVRRRLAQSALCAAPGAQAQACGICVSCRRFAVGTHPDLFPVAPIDESVIITIEQVRSIRDFAALTPHTSARKVVILEPAEAMNVNAANALLKVLEEPPAGNVLLLITAHAARLSPTIRSRCVNVPFRAPERQAASAWLSQQGVDDASRLLAVTAAPLRALALRQSSGLKNREQLHKDIEALGRDADDPLRCAARWKNFGTESSLSWFQDYLARAIRREMETGKFSLQVRGLFAYLDVLSEAKSLLGGP